jgi:UPF0042 nucleotide-binding protein
MTGGRFRFVLVTGPSGAGRATAVRALEDLDCEVIDNLPLSLVPRLLEGPALDRILVLGIDVRNRDFGTAAFLETAEYLRAREVDVEILYLDCRPDVLARRFSETRRRHPMAPLDTPVEGIEREIELLVPVRARADIVIDTSELSVHDLRSELSRQFDPNRTGRLALSLHSFSYKQGMPRGIDTLFDCRFLRNPYWVPALRPLDGRMPDVAEYVTADPRFDSFFRYVSEMVEFLLPAYLDEGKAHLSIGFGCTGGQHRSVAMVERLAAHLEGKGWRTSIRHHELERRSHLTPSPVPGPPP